MFQATYHHDLTSRTSANPDQTFTQDLERRRVFITVIIYGLKAINPEPLTLTLRNFVSGDRGGPQKALRRAQRGFACRVQGLGFKVSSLREDLSCWSPFCWISACVNNKTPAALVLSLRFRL